MSIEVIDTIVPKNGGNFPTVNAQNVSGGYRVVADNTARDAISASFRAEGMLVRTLDTGKMWVLNANLTTWTLLKLSDVDYFTSGGFVDRYVDLAAGVDTNTGSSSSKWRTIQRALDDVPTGFKATVRIYLTGTTVTETSIVLSAQPGGTSNRVWVIGQDANSESIASITDGSAVANRKAQRSYPVAFTSNVSAGGWFLAATSSTGLPSGAVVLPESTSGDLRLILASGQTSGLTNMRLMQPGTTSFPSGFRISAPIRQPNAVLGIAYCAIHCAGLMTFYSVYFQCCKFTAPNYGNSITYYQCNLAFCWFDNKILPTLRIWCQISYSLWSYSMTCWEYSIFMYSVCRATFGNNTPGGLVLGYSEGYSTSAQSGGVVGDVDFELTGALSAIAVRSFATLNHRSNTCNGSACRYLETSGVASALTTAHSFTGTVGLPILVNPGGRVINMKTSSDLVNGVNPGQDVTVGSAGTFAWDNLPQTDVSQLAMGT